MHIRHKNILLLIIGIVVAFFLARYEPFHNFLLGLGNLGYIGAFLGGILYIFSFTAAAGIVIILVLAEKLSPIEIGLIAGLGSVTGDFIIFRFVKDDLTKELSPIYSSLGGGHLTKLLRTKYFSWTLPVIGALIIASPFPDEVGVSLMGISKMKASRFILVSFLLNAIGIFLIISASTFIKP